MKKILIALALILSIVPALARTWQPADVPNVQLQDRTKHLSNPEGIISPAAAARIDSLLYGLRRSSSAEATVVVIDRIDPSTDIDHFATELFDLWRPGKSDKDNGLLIVIAAGDRRAAIRTGYGLEGVLPDILAGRIIRDVMAPDFREGDYDAGTVNAVNVISTILTDPEAAEEIRSKLGDDFDDDDDVDLWYLYLNVSIAAGVLTMLALLISLVVMRKRDRYTKYQALEHFKLATIVSSFFFLLMPLPTALLILLLLRYWRNAPRRCPNCHTRMKKLDEEHDNEHLSPSQDTEERLGSVDYDVWLCPACGEKDIFPFVNKQSPLHECPVCHARTARLIRAQVIVPATTRRPGRGEKTYYCENCHQTSSEPYEIPRKQEAPVVVVPGGGRGGFGGGGSFGGGFGGGFTGGGGASGGW